MTERSLSSIWPGRRPLVGMVHLPPLPGSPRWAGSMEAVVERACTDARALQTAGFDGLLVENYGDVPFHGGEVPHETVAAMTAAVVAVRAVATLPVGVNVLRNDASAALAIAAATGARFIRVNVHTGSMWTDQGLLEGQAARTLRTRTTLDATVAVLADVHVKHATPPGGSDLGTAASDAWHRGLADGLIVTGRGTGASTSLEDVRAVRAAVPEARIWVGSGAHPGDAAEILTVADGVIVGSAVMVEGIAGRGVDPSRATAFVESARG